MDDCLSRFILGKLYILLNYRNTSIGGSFMYNIIDNNDYFNKNINFLEKYEKGKCYFKIDYNRDSSIGDTYSTLSTNFLNSGGIISDTEYCVDSSFDYDGFYDD